MTAMIVAVFIDSELAGRLAVQAMVRMVGVYIISEISWKVRKQKCLSKFDLIIGLVGTIVFGIFISGGIDSVLDNLLLGLWSASWLFLYNFCILDKFWGIKNNASVRTKTK